MDNGQTYMHPLDGPAGAETKPEAERTESRKAPLVLWSVAHVAAVPLLVIVALAAAIYGGRQRQQAEAVRETLRQAQESPVYEPLSQAGDGSYDASEGGRSRAVLQRLKGWRARH
jgi:hypothetical protein